MSEWVRVAAYEEIPVGTGMEVVAGSHVIALFRIGEEIHALDGICPHAGGPLAKGVLNGCIVTCPWHGWQFDVTSGQHCLTATLKHTTFPVENRQGEIWVQI
ncbi:MAG: Rieske 2Fe-2S domain-containing protein [Planctomycetales bacterium]